MRDARHVAAIPPNLAHRLLYAEAVTAQLDRLGAAELADLSIGTSRETSI